MWIAKFLKKLKGLSVIWTEIMLPKGFGFIEGKSIQDAILNGITQNIAKSVPTIFILVDFKKAFNTVSNIQHLEVMAGIGFRRVNMAWKQCVKLATTMSDFRFVEYGVPQGTILEPILFNI